MVECSVCSFVTFIFTCLYNLLVCALEYPFFVFLLCFLIALVFVTNVHMAKLICDFGCSGSGAAVCGNGSATNFDYGPDRGPHAWRCTDENQSPINIMESDAQKFPIRELLTWNHYDDLPSGIMLENNGHTVIVRASYCGNTPTISGADLLASYTFVELCFRWSLFNDEGSEHMINNKKFPLELQAMHRTGPAGECTSSYDLLMVAYFFELSGNNPYLDPIVQNLHRVKRPGSRIEIPPFPLAYLCHQFRTGFFSYGGSLTEPPCYQGAEWFVFAEPMAISDAQLNEFRSILSSDGKSRILRNSRPVQNLSCSRVVNYNQYNPMEAGCTREMEIEEECIINETFDVDVDADEEDCEQQ